MSDFDFSKGNYVAAVILFPMAFVGFLSNLTVVAFIRMVKSLKNPFGSLTLSQAVADCIHQAIFAFYLAPCIASRSDQMYSWSEQFGFSLITVYNVCGTAHVCISFNRFVAVYFPFAYSTIFSKTSTIFLICVYWLFGIGSTTFLLKMIDCANNLPKGGWVFGFIDTPTCNLVLWYVEFIKYVVYVGIVAVLDFSSIMRIHYINIRHRKIGQSNAAAERARNERNLVYQAALQGIFFLVELITYFILSPYARNKWELFLLTTISWCLVHGMDGFIVLTFNRDFRHAIKKVLRARATVETRRTSEPSGGTRATVRTITTANEHDSFYPG